MMLRTDGRGVVTSEGKQRLKDTQHRAGLAFIHGLRAEHLLAFRGERGHGFLAFSTATPSAVCMLHPPGLCRNRASNVSNPGRAGAAPPPRRTDTVRSAGS